MAEPIEAPCIPVDASEQLMNKEKGNRVQYSQKVKSTASNTASADDTTSTRRQFKLEDIDTNSEAEGEPPPVARRKWTIFDPFNVSPPPPPPKSMDDAETIKLASASWLSSVTFVWLQPLFVLGYKRELAATDVPKMDQMREAGMLAHLFLANFDKRRKKVEEWNRALETGSTCRVGGK
ncbi:hypothetical protein JCM11641_002491 [Rhodosporidiobolus odoratus]